MVPIDVLKIDHIHRYTEDKWEAAKWYEKHFGFTIMPEMEAHARSGTYTPLDVINKEGNIILALFTARNKSDMQSTSTIAMRTTAASFIQMIEQAKPYGFLKRNGDFLTKDDIIFHKPSHDVSVYFVDPWGNSIEIITHYDHSVSQAFPGLSHS